MNILVLDVAASEGGALSILNHYYSRFQNDTDNQYVFCISTPQLEPRQNTRILRFPWVKKTWMHRLWFEIVWVKKLVRQYHIDCVFSLENLIITNPPCIKWIYLHMSIPFSKIHFSLKKDPLMWVYQHIVGRLIKDSIKKADKVIVQTKWMRDACLKQAGLKADVVEIQQPEIPESSIILCTDREKVRNRLFYPATPLKYKNHMLVLSALKRLKESGKLGELQLDLTLTGQENALSRQIAQYVETNKLPVNFLGQLSRTHVMDQYSKSVLIFSSYLETFGLPLLEARKTGTLILASDCDFSREILYGYDGAIFFDPFDVGDCATCILKAIADYSDG